MQDEKFTVMMDEIDIGSYYEMFIDYPKNLRKDMYKVYFLIGRKTSSVGHTHCTFTKGKFFTGDEWMNCIIDKNGDVIEQSVKGHPAVGSSFDVEDNEYLVMGGYFETIEECQYVVSCINGAYYHRHGNKFNSEEYQSIYDAVALAIKSQKTDLDEQSGDMTFTAEEVIENGVNVLNVNEFLPEFDMSVYTSAKYDQLCLKQLVESLESEITDVSLKLSNMQSKLATIKKLVNGVYGSI